MDCKKRRWLSAIAAVVAVCMLLSGCRQELPPATEPAETETQPVETAVPVEETTLPQETIVELPPAAWNTVPEIEATYEQWLAAAMIMILSLEHPDFEILGIYAGSETDISNCASSLGAYIHCSSAGEELLLHSKPLDGERSEKGTTDLYTSQLGFATFDRVQVDGVDLGTLIALDMSDLAQLIDYSILVSLYSR